MQEAGCATAYNLDGGGSSTLYFNGRVLNNPTTNGRTISERAVSDIVYIGRGIKTSGCFSQPPSICWSPCCASRSWNLCPV